MSIDPTYGDGAYTEAGELEPGTLVLVAHGPGGLSITDPGDQAGCWRTATAVEQLPVCAGNEDSGCTRISFGSGSGDSVHVSADLQIWTTEPW